VERFGQLGKDPAHFLGRLHVKLIVGEAQALGVAARPAGLDTKQRVVRRRVVLAEIVGVVGGDQRNAGLLGQFDQARVDPLFLFQALILHFEDSLIAHFHLNWLSPSKIRSTIIGGEKKMLLWDDMDPENKIRIYDKGVDIADQEGVYQMLYSYRWGDMWAPRISNAEALYQELSYLRDCLEQGKNPHNDGQAGLRVVKLLEASSRSLAQGGKTIEF